MLKEFSRDYITNLEELQYTGEIVHTHVRQLRLIYQPYRSKCTFLHRSQYIYRKGEKGWS